jgi:hypothetical protein
MSDKHATAAGAANRSRREEKLSALAALLGPDAMERLRSREAGFDATATTGQTPSPDRLAWHSNRLLQRLRARWADGKSGSAGGTAGAKHSGRADGGDRPERGGATVTGETSPGIDTRIAFAADLSALAGEHPAVIARLLQSVDRTRRVELLRQLPGHTARAVVRRLKAN